MAKLCRGPEPAKERKPTYHREETVTDFFKKSMDLHALLHGKISVEGKLRIESADDLSTVYTPGVAAPCRAIAADPARARDLTIKRNSVAVVSDGSAVLGLGNIGALAAIPVMEGKAMLFKQYAGIDAWPLCLESQDTETIIQTVRQIAPVFGGINLEDIAAPRCFEVEAALQDVGIPVFHDDQHGTAIVLLAGLMNAAKVTGRELTDMRVVVAGAGAAGTAIARLLRCVNFDPDLCQPIREIVICDSKGAIHRGRGDLTPAKLELLKYTNRADRAGTLLEVMEGADAFIGVSRAGLLGARDVARMAPKSIVFAMANPEPEIMPDEAKAGGAAIVGTGRSDFPNQVNNVLAFPGIFRGALDAAAPRITEKMILAAAHALAGSVDHPTADHVLPSALDASVAPRVARAVAAAAEGQS